MRTASCSSLLGSLVCLCKVHDSRTTIWSHLDKHDEMPFFLFAWLFFRLERPYDPEHHMSFMSEGGILTDLMVFPWEVWESTPAKLRSAGNAVECNATLRQTVEDIN